MLTAADAHARDIADPLAHFRHRFHLIPNTIYMDGNSLGLLSYDAETHVMRMLAEWKELGIGGWANANPPWYYTGENLGTLMAPLVGAEPDEVIATGTTTVNLHSLVATFYRPTRSRRKILCTALDFPSDIYALASEVALQGGDPSVDLLAIPSEDGRTIAEDAIIAAMTDEVALILLPSVLYRGGQLLDMARLTVAAHAQNIPIGFDCAHSIGAVPHSLSDWNVDFAFWCGYKYLNGGPGTVGGIYVNRRHLSTLPALRGWWGYDKLRQFDMAAEFIAAGTAGSWQISANPLLSAAPLYGSLQIIAEADIEAIRTKSLALTDYLIALMSELTQAPYSFVIGTPLDHHRRGGHVAIEHPEGARIAKALKSRGVIPDFRPPTAIRLAPIALYNTYFDVWQTVQHLRDIIDTQEYLQFAPGRDLIA